MAAVFTFGKASFVYVPKAPIPVVWLPFRKYAFFAVGSAGLAVMTPVIGIRAPDRRVDRLVGTVTKP